MNPTTQPQIPIIDGKLNGGKPLTPQQIQQMRSQTGVTPISRPGSSPSPSNVEARIASLRAGTYGEPVKTVEPSIAEKIQNKIHGVVDPLIDGVKTVAGNVIQSTKDIQKNSLDNVQKDIESVNPLKSGLGTTSDLIQFILAPLSGLIEGGVVKETSKALGESKLGSDIANSSGGKAILDVQDRLGQIAKEHPDAVKAIMDAINVAMTAAGGEKLPEAIDQFKTGVASDVSAVKGGIESTFSSVESPLKVGEDLYHSAKTHLAETNVDPRLETSAGRLKDPLETYNQFLEQEKKAKVDVKADSPLSTVGERVGNSFDKVVKMRKGVGETMGAELKNIGNEAVDIKPAAAKFQTGLEENNLTFDPKEGTFSAEGQSKMTSSDLEQLAEYRKELSKLVNTKQTTVKAVDAFVSRMSKELDLYKSKNNIMGTTNAERIIKSSLHDMTEQFNPEVSGNKAFQKYYDARTSYSKLSDFLEEGQSYLGKKTQTGDYARDTSLTKSSVQSLLNGGKKDWLSTLEGLTGYPALDESVMALQSMKDLGDAKGASLLQLMSEGSIPMTKSGITQKVLDFILNKAKDVFVGSPEEQTQTFLKSLLDEKNKSILDDNGEDGVKMGLSTKDITSKLTSKDHSLMQKYIDDVRLKGSDRPAISKAEESDLFKLNELLGISEGASKQTIANKYETILAGSKK